MSVGLWGWWNACHCLWECKGRRRAHGEEPRSRRWAPLRPVGCRPRLPFRSGQPVSSWEHLGPDSLRIPTAPPGRAVPGPESLSALGCRLVGTVSRRLASPPVPALPGVWSESRPDAGFPFLICSQPWTQTPAPCSLWGQRDVCSSKPGLGRCPRPQGQSPNASPCAHLHYSALWPHRLPSAPDRALSSYSAGVPSPPSPPRLDSSSRPCCLSLDGTSSRQPSLIPPSLDQDPPPCTL